jgi:transcriptional regulator with XRE-family HTH domain
MPKSSVNRRILDELISLLKKRRGKMSMTVLAQKSGVSLSMISFIERGLRNPTLDKLLDIADALEVDLWKLLREATLAAKK